MDLDEVAEVEMAVTPAPDDDDAPPPYAPLLPLFTPFPFTHDVCDNIQSRRAHMFGELIFDLLLLQAGVTSPATLYPPDSGEALEQLLDAIQQCPWDTLKKSALHFYLLCFVDVNTAHQATSLPPHFASLAQACYFLDSGDIPSLEKAVALLSDGRIVQDLAPKILQTLEASKEPRLVRTYVRTAQPVLNAFEEASVYVRALLDQSLTEAWSFQRGFAEESTVRNQLMRVILDCCLMPPNPKHLPQLLALPLSAFESALLQAYALSPPSELSHAGNAALQDLLTVRLLSAGRYSDAIRISRAFDEVDKVVRVEKGPEADTQPLVRAAAERRSTMRAVLNVLPAVQRRELEGELGSLGDLPSHVNGMTGSLPNREARMNGREPENFTSSWEDLAMSTSSRAGRLEGSPVPGRVTSSSRIPSGKGSMGISIFGAPIGSHTPSKATPPVRPLQAAGTISTGPRPSMSKSSAPAPGMVPKPIPTVIQPPTPSQRPVFASPHAGPSTIKSLSIPPRTGRFGIQITPTPPPGVVEPSPQPAPKPPAQTARDLFTSASTLKETTPPPLFGRSRTGSPAGKAAGTRVEDIQMVESDDPDAFVVHGRGNSRTSFGPPSPPLIVEPEPTPSQEEDLTEVEEQIVSPPTSHVPPGGFTSFEPREPEQPGEEPEPPQESKPKKPPSRRSTRRSASVESPPQLLSASTRRKIPGALYEEEEDEEEEEEQRDEVPSLPSPKRTTRRATRARQSSASVESGDDDDESGRRLRRSTRLSSMDHSPDKKKKPAKESTGGRTTRKRKAT